MKKEEKKKEVDLIKSSNKLKWTIMLPVVVCPIGGFILGTNWNEALLQWGCNAYWAFGCMFVLFIALSISIYMGLESIIDTGRFYKNFMEQYEDLSLRAIRDTLSMAHLIEDLGKQFDKDEENGTEEKSSEKSELD